MIDFQIGSSTVELIVGVLGFFGVLFMGMTNVWLCPPKNMSKKKIQPNPNYQAQFGWPKQK